MTEAQGFDALQSLSSNPVEAPVEPKIDAQGQLSGGGYAESSPLDRGPSLVPGHWGAQVVDELEVHDEFLEQLDGDPSSELSFAGLMPADNDAVEFADVAVAAAEAPVPEPPAPVALAPVAPRPALFDQHADENESAPDWRPAPMVIRTEPQSPVAPRSIDPLLRKDIL